MGERFSHLGGIILPFVQVLLIDLIMSGDNALMISITTQGLKKKERAKAMLFGIGGAMILRICFALGISYMLFIPFIKPVGAILLCIIAGKLYKQFRDKPVHERHHHQGNNRVHALRLILIADFSMSLDNVLAVASASAGNTIALIAGIVLSIVLMTTVSTAINALLTRFRWIQWLGFALIVFLALKMFLESVHHFIPFDYHLILYRICGMSAIGLITYFHRKYLTTFEIHEGTSFLFNHAPFIILCLLFFVASMLFYGLEIHNWLDMHKSIQFTLFLCFVLLALEMISLERVKHTIKLQE